MFCAALALTASLWTAAAGDRDLERAEVVVVEGDGRASLTPFTATIHTIDNIVFGPFGFEPAMIRTMVPVTGGDGDRVYAKPHDLSFYEIIGPAVFDGGHASILRVDDGRMRLIREGPLAADGFEPRFWERKLALPPAAEPVARLAFKGWNRPGVPYWFAVAALDDTGRRSALSAPVRIDAPDTMPAEPGALTENLTVKVAGDTAALPAPQGLAGKLWRDGTIELTWNPVADAAAYVVFRADAPLDPAVRTHFRFAEPGPAVLPGDLAILRSDPILDVADPALMANRAANGFEKERYFQIRPTSMARNRGMLHRASLVAHDAQAAAGGVPDGGRSHLRVMLNPGERFPLGDVAFGGGKRHFYQVLRPDVPYRAEMWLRADAPRAVSFEVYTEPKSRAAGQRPMRAAVDTTWRKVAFDFRVGDLGQFDGLGYFRLMLQGPGRFDIDNLVIVENTGPVGSLSETAEAQLGPSGMAALRTHKTIKTKARTYDLEALIAGPASAHHRLVASLNAMATLGTDPWLQIEPHLARDEWLGLAEYLAAPFDPAIHDPAERPWAARRHAQGHDTPWIDRFERVYFEIGNEIWNQSFRPWSAKELRDHARDRNVGGGEMHGHLNEYVLGVLATSPWWDRLAPKLVPVIGGRTLGPYGHDALAASPSTAFHLQGAYIMGYDDREHSVPTPTPVYYSRLLMRVLNGAQYFARDHLARARETAAARGAPVRLGTYEAGPGYMLRGEGGRRLSDDEWRDQEVVMKSAAAGIATLDSFMAFASLGYELQNYFTYGEGRRWTSHYRWHDGGHPVPAWALLSWANRHATGRFLPASVVSGPTIDLPRDDLYKPAVTGGSLIGAYATREGGRVTLMLISRRMPGYPDAGDDGRTAVTVTLPFDGADRLTIHRMTGGPTDTNQGAHRVAILPEAAPVPATMPMLETVLEPGSVQFYVFEGVD
ncbi:MAG: hypothetical protein AAF899_05640 [Pseudomonadota bacterium]